MEGRRVGGTVIGMGLGTGGGVKVKGERGGDGDARRGGRMSHD